MLCATLVPYFERQHSHHHPTPLCDEGLFSSDQYQDLQRKRGKLKLNKLMLFSASGMFSWTRKAKERHLLLMRGRVTLRGPLCFLTSKPHNQDVVRYFLFTWLLFSFMTRAPYGGSASGMVHIMLTHQHGGIQKECRWMMSTLEKKTK